MFLKIFFSLLFLLVSGAAFSQQCDCAKEFTHIKNFMEKNYVGFNDKIKIITRTVYDKKVKQFQQMAASQSGKEKCLLITSGYLQLFKDAHVSISAAFSSDAVDSGFIANREQLKLTDKKLASLKDSKTIEGIYYFKYDSSYKIAVIKSPTALRDYAGVLISSKWPVWKQGMVKLEAKQLSKGMMKGVLYTRNHMPRVEWFGIGDNTLGGDWQREGSGSAAANNNEYVWVSSKKLSDKTLYIRISTFGASNGKRIDSVFKANKELLESMPNLVLDLRDNGGGADFTYGPIIPYIYTNPIKTIGLNAWSTDSTIAGWSKILLDEDIPQSTKESLQKRIDLMKANKGKMVNIFDDDIDSSYSRQEFPKKVVILINDGCASTTEQFLFAAKQSTKVTLAGDHTEGVLDYSNVRETPFPCMPYILNYSSTRSRRIEAGQAIDNVGIKPDVYFKKGSNWVEDARVLLEGKK
jgi:hypothetical protein